MNEPLTEKNMLIYPLSGLQMMKLNPNAHIITYDKLSKIYDINDLFESTTQVIILYLLHSKDSGHWTTLFLNAHGINFFDSYGCDMDKWINRLSNEKLQNYKEQRNRLHHLLKNYNVIYNNVELQAKDTQTCGMFVSHRLNSSNMSEKKYIDTYFLNSNKSPDVIVAEYCLKKLN